MFSQFWPSQFELGPLLLMQDLCIGHTNKLARQKIVHANYSPVLSAVGYMRTFCRNWCKAIIRLRGNTDTDRSALEIFVGRDPGTSSHPFQSSREVKNFYGGSRCL